MGSGRGFGGTDSSMYAWGGWSMTWRRKANTHAKRTRPNYVGKWDGRGASENKIQNVKKNKPVERAGKGKRSEHTQRTPVMTGGEIYRKRGRKNNRKPARNRVATGSCIYTQPREILSNNKRCSGGAREK